MAASREEKVRHNFLKTTSISNFFIVVALIFGGIFCFRIQPLFGSDEIVHFPRAFQIQSGTLNVQHISGNDYGGQVPVQIKEFNDAFREQVQNPTPDKGRMAQLKVQYSHERLQNKGTAPLAFTSAGVYSSWAYLPAVLGMWLARLFNLPIIWYVYLARIFCLLVWIGLSYLALRIIPVGKLLMMAIMVLPTTLVQASTIDMDGMVNGLSWLIIALVFAIIAKKIRLKPKILWTLGLIALYLVNTKQGYFLIAALPLVIPHSYFGLKRKITTPLRIGFATVLFALTVWYISSTAAIAGILHFIQRPGLNVDETAQLGHIFMHPFHVLYMMLIQPFTGFYAGIYAGLVGTVTNQLIHLPLVIMILLYIGLLLAALSLRDNEFLQKYSLRLRVATGVVWFGTFILINAALYLSFTQVNFGHIEGLQGRYFLPLLPLLIPWFLLVPAKIRNSIRPYATYATPAISIVGLIATVGKLHL